MSNSRRPETPDPANHSHSRASSGNSFLSASSQSSSNSVPQAHAHAPQTPSRLRQSHAPGPSPSPETHPHQYTSLSSSPPLGDSPVRESSLRSPSSLIDLDSSGFHPQLSNAADATEDLAATRVEGHIAEEHSRTAADANTRLLENYNRKEPDCGNSVCSHGTFSPRAASFAREEGGDIEDRYRDEEEDQERRNDGERHFPGDATNDGYIRVRPSRPKWGRLDSFVSWKGIGNGKQKSATRWLAEAHGIKGKRRMYLSYYIPFFNWIGQYRLAFLKGDLVAAITMASFYIPMSLSYAANLGHVPPINGLYSFVFNPLLYAFLGTCPQMVVGPEAPGSLLLGNVVRSSVDKGGSYDNDDILHARIAGVVTGMAGAIIFVAGLTRLGFLENVLSRPFLRGFISAIGVVIFIDQLVPEMGLVEIQKQQGLDHSSSVEKLIFVIKNAYQANALTCWVSFGSFAIIMFCREAKKRLQPRIPSVAYIPDRFIVVVLSAIFTYLFSWHTAGLDILGEVKSSTGSAFPFHWPFIPQHMTHIREAMSTSFLIALLGFFESTVAGKSLSVGDNAKPGEPGIQGMSLSANRELVALGVANLVGGCFMALPAFGGYGRSKVNASTGGRTPMSSIFLSLLTIISVLYLVPYFYYLPKGVLSAMVSVVAYSLIEECPHDIRFFIRAKGYSELALMFLIFLATILYSLPLGIALGMGLSLLRVIRHATQPRIQILGRVPGTIDQFENAEDNPVGFANTHGGQGVEFIPGALIVKIPEPLTFANTGDLRSRLRRLELYGTQAAHPALPRVRGEEHMRNVVFDVHGVTSIDASGAQVLCEIVDSYMKRGSRVFFCRVPGGPGGHVMSMFERSGIIECCGGGEGFVRGVEEALKLAEREQEPLLGNGEERREV